MKTDQLPTDEYRGDFYPTPKHIADLMLADIKWSEVKRVLEPSAGKGDLAEAIADHVHKGTYRDLGREIIDCIEIDPTLRATLKGKELRVVHDDFLRWDTLTAYDLIVMNPPFSKGAEHLLHALALLRRNGGSVVCLLNAETIINLHTNIRKQLKRLLQEYEASVEFLESAFSDAERDSKVSVALIKCTVPKTEHDGILLSNLRKAKRDPAVTLDSNEMDLARSEYIQAILDRYEFEATTGASLIQEYLTLAPYMQDSVSEYSSPILTLECENSTHFSINDYLRKLRRKYWAVLFTNERFMQNMTSDVQTTMHNMLPSLEHYDFSHFNIMQLQIEMRNELLKSIKGTIMRLFDDWTHRYAFYDGSQNIHYFNGWRTNDAFKVGKKIIIPFYESLWGWNKRFTPTSYGVAGTISDMQKVFDYLCGELPDSKGVQENLRWAENHQINTKIPMKYFRLSFYKKGTVHVEFINMNALYRFNLYGARNKNWLPPVYGKKSYENMDDEERAVIDSFEGADSYKRLMENPDAYLFDDEMMLPSCE